MDLLSVFKRKPPPAAADAVQLARTRARQRLIGAAVLVVAGIIGFPLLFETQPRPIPVDLPIEIPRKDDAPPLALPAVPAAPAEAPAPARAASPSERVITETKADAGRELAASATAPAAASQALTSRTVALAPPARASAPAEPAPAEAARAQALLEDRPTMAASAAAGSGRFVVQVGAFAEPAAAKEARAKVEKLGLKTYTQVANTPEGARTRVRVGPFDTRDEAEKAAARIKATALPTVILTL